jgi:hypothetical protein
MTKGIGLLSTPVFFHPYREVSVPFRPVAGGDHPEGGPELRIWYTAFEI